MTNNEIDKILEMLDKNDIDQLKKHLELLRKNNNKKLVQRTFKNYITTNAFGLNSDTLPKLCTNYEDGIAFTNGIGIYHIKSGIIKVNEEILKHTSGSYTVKHRFELKNEEYFKKLFNKAKNLYVNGDSAITIEDNQYTGDTDFYGYNSECKIKSKEINTSNILFNNPEYFISAINPVVYAKSDIGKVYILGYKKEK